MDADTRLNDGSAGTVKCTKGDHKAAYSAKIPCTRYANGTCARGDKCRFSHKGSDAKSSGKSVKGKKASNERDRCMKCGKITNPSHWAKSCLETISAKVALTTSPSLSVSEAVPPGLHLLLFNSADSEDTSALAAILRDALSLGGSSDSGRTARLAALARSAGYVVRQKFLVFVARDQNKHLSMVGDSGAEVHLVCPAHKQFIKNVGKCSIRYNWRPLAEI